MEEWKEFRKGYSISNHGRVRNDETMKIRKLSIRRSYLSIYIVDKNYVVHRLVASYFLEKSNSDFNVVNHLDSNRLNNHYTNLEWTDVKGNTKHCYDKKRHTSIWSEEFKRKRAKPNVPAKARKRYLPIGVKKIKQKTKDKYVAQIGNNEKGLVYLGIYDTIEEAYKKIKDWYFNTYGVYPMENFTYNLKDSV